MNHNINLNDLQYHGILGQKWGVRNGPPYPLGGGDYSSSEKKRFTRKENCAIAYTIKSISMKF